MNFSEIPETLLFFYLGWLL